MVEQVDGMEKLKNAYDDGVLEVNGREYEFTEMRHMKRRDVFAYFTTVQNAVQAGNFAFLSDPNFRHIEKIIGDHVTYDGSLLSKLADHWDEFPEDYLELIATSMGVISYPFMRGRRTD